MVATLRYEKYIHIQIREFSSANLDYTPLDQSPRSSMKLWSIFDPRSNENVAHYGDGTHGNIDRTSKKIDLWGQRGENGNPLRCFLVTEKGADRPAGFINLGQSTAELKGVKLYEGGFLFNHQYNYNPNATEAINSIYVDYLQQMHTEGVLPAPAFIYTISADNPLYDVMRNSTLELINLFAPSHDQNCILNAMTATNRFKVHTANGTITDDNREVEVFYHMLDNSYCPDQAVAGEAPQAHSEL